MTPTKLHDQVLPNVSNIATLYPSFIPHKPSHLLFLLPGVFLPLLFKLLDRFHSVSLSLNRPSLRLLLKVDPFISTHHQYGLFLTIFSVISKEEYMHCASRPGSPPEISI